MGALFSKRRAAAILSALLCSVTVPVWAETITVESGQTETIPWTPNSTITTTYEVKDGGILTLEGSSGIMEMVTDGTSITIAAPDEGTSSSGTTELILHSGAGGYYTTDHFHITASGSDASALLVEQGAYLNSNSEVNGTDTHFIGQKNGISYYGNGSFNLYGGITLQGIEGNGLEMTGGSEGTVYLESPNHVIGGTNGMVVTGGAHVVDTGSATYIYGAYERVTSPESDAQNYGQDGRQGAAILAQDYTGDADGYAVRIYDNNTTFLRGTTGLDVQSSRVSVNTSRLEISAFGVDTSDDATIQPNEHDGIGVFSGHSSTGTLDSSVTLAGSWYISVDAADTGLYADQGTISLTGGSITVDAEGNGLDAKQGDISLTSNYGSITVDAGVDGLYATDQGSITLTSSRATTVTAEGNGLYADQGTITLDSDTTTSVTAGADGLYAANDGSISLTSGSSISVNAEGNGAQAEQGTISLTSSSNTVNAGSDGIGLYAGDGGTITLSGSDTDSYSLQTVTGSTAIRSVASTNPAAVTVSGLLQIDGTDTAVESAADGSGATTSTVSLTYGPAASSSTVQRSTINGTLRAYKGGSIAVQRGENGSPIDLTGDVLAYGNTQNETGGTISLYLDQDSTLTGAADTGLALYNTTQNNGTIDLVLDDSSIWNMTGSSAVTSISGDGGTVYYENGGDSLQIQNLTGSHTFYMDLSMTGSESDMLYIYQGTSDPQTLVVKNLDELEETMGDGDAVRFATISHSQNEFRDGTVLAYYPNGVYNDKMSIQYRRIRSDEDNNTAYNNAYNGDGTRKPTTAQVEAMYLQGDLTDARNVYVVKNAKNNVNEGALTPGRITDGLWHYMAELDTYDRRTGQAMYFTPGAKNDAWIRMDYKNVGVDDVGEIAGNTYELGYTSILSETDRQRHSLGFSGSFADTHGHLEGFGGQLKIYDRYLGIYDTHEYFEEGKSDKPALKSYWDNYLKVHRIKTDYNTIDTQTKRSYEGDHTQTAVSLSSEYGRHLNIGDSSWYWVPQGQLQLSYMGSYDYVDSQKLHISGDHSWSLIGRLGVDLVRNLDPKLDSKFYVKASVLHEFLDGGSVRTAAYARDGWDPGVYTSDNDQRGTWAEVGIGYSAKIGPNQYMFFDAQRDFGNDFDRTYKLTASVRWKF
jgi:outer membrane autotransporter protein